MESSNDVIKEKGKSLMTLISSIMSITALISVVFGAYFFIDNRYALSETVKKVEQRLDYKIKADQFDNVQAQIWKIEDRYKDLNLMPDTVKEQYRELKSQMEKLRLTIKNFQEKGTQDPDNKI